MLIVNFIDAPDPDNFVQVLASQKAFGPEFPKEVCLTGRPVKLNATKETPHWQYNVEQSRAAQVMSAERLLNFLRVTTPNFERFGYDIYDGGIAPRTLVPHWVHFKDYYKFDDVDPLSVIGSETLKPQSDLIGELASQEFYAVVGGPMTGLAQCIQRNPEVAKNCKGVFAMFATWGDVDLMSLDGTPRGALQFNVACDPFAAYQVLHGLKCPIYMIPSECTRVDEIGFTDAEEFADFASPGNQELVDLYRKWYEAACKPRGEKIYIHDVCSVFALYDYLSFDPDMSPEQVYEYKPVKVEVPHLATESSKWGTISLTPCDAEDTNIFCATKVDVERYKYLLSTTLNAKS